MPKFKLYLSSIHYTGGNIGNDIQISIRTLGNTYSLDLGLRNGEQKKFEPLEFIAEDNFNRQKKELRRKISITVIERDPQRDDKGKKEAFQIIEVSTGSQFSFSQSVTVIEDNNLINKRKPGHFDFTFTAVFPHLEQEVSKGMKLPILTPPILNQTKPKFLRWSCDSICLFKCAPNDWPCIVNCCKEHIIN